MDFLQAYCLTLIVEGAVLFILLRSRYAAALIAKNTFVASTLTLPLVWFVFPRLGMAWSLQVAISEVFAVAAESGAYLLLFKKLGARDAVLVSAACNLASFLAGMAIS
ncbi:MAG: hypothetical protein PHV13_00410 [Candidatus ainarchaeum sp.]|nr:hypothetical protein [Candidatus ainarchaeum sp.]